MRKKEGGGERKKPFISHPFQGRKKRKNTQRKEGSQKGSKFDPEMGGCYGGDVVWWERRSKLLLWHRISHADASQSNFQTLLWSNSSMTCKKVVNCRNWSWSEKKLFFLFDNIYFLKCGLLYGDFVKHIPSSGFCTLQRTTEPRKNFHLISFPPAQSPSLPPKQSPGMSPTQNFPSPPSLFHGK